MNKQKVAVMVALAFLAGGAVDGLIGFVLRAPGCAGL